MNTGKKLHSSQVKWLCLAICTAAAAWMTACAGADSMGGSMAAERNGNVPKSRPAAPPDAGPRDAQATLDGSEHDAAPADDAATADDAAADDASVDAGASDAASPDRASLDELAWFQLSPDDSTSMASAQLAKISSSYSYAYSGSQLKSHEIINYYDPPTAVREAGALKRSWTSPEGLFLGVDAERIPGDGADDELALLVHVFAPAGAVEQRRPWNLHLCVDVSGSMSGEKIAFARESLARLTDALRPGDRISLTTFTTDATVVFETLPWEGNEARIRADLCGLTEQQGTNMIAGLRMAYAEAQRAYDPAAINRVLLFSDGNANVGDTDVATFAGLTRINNQEGIYLSGVGVGTDYDMERMNALTDAGKGAHVFLPNQAEVEIIFGRMVRKLIEVAADEVAVEVQLPGAFRLAGFSGEEVSQDPTVRVPNVVLAAGDDMTLLARFATPLNEAFDRNLTITLRYRTLRDGTQRSFTQTLPIGEILGTGSPLLRRTQLLDSYGRLLRGELGAGETMGLASQARELDPKDMGLREVACLLDARGRGLDPTSCSAEGSAMPEGSAQCSMGQNGWNEYPYPGRSCNSCSAASPYSAPVAGGALLMLVVLAWWPARRQR